MRRIITIIAVLGSSPSAWATGGGALADYVAKEDSSYHWTKRTEGQLGEGSYVELTLTSQTWRGIVWKHQLYIIRPPDLGPDTTHALLFISGGRWKPELEKPIKHARLPKKSELFAHLAEQLQTPVAVLRQVPQQPILGGRKEDEIIALSFEQYLATGDPEWPLLLPMVKSAVRAMDTAQEYLRREWALEISSFTVTGASKRGWTTWLTAAADERVTAIAPMVIDMLRMGPQLEYQKAVWGGLSDKIGDYTELGLHEQLGTAAGESLQAIVDPYSYREILTQPKLIIIGTNDRYWPLDALNLYWDDLPGPKYMLYVPNNRHSLKDYGRIVGSINALHQHVARGHRLPQLTWQFGNGDRRLSLRVESDLAPDNVVAWVATSATRDFREAAWRSHPLHRDGDSYVYELPLPKSGYTAIFGEAVYDPAGAAPYFLSTNVRVAAAEGAGVNFLNLLLRD